MLQEDLSTNKACTDVCVKSHTNERRNYCNNIFQEMRKSNKCASNPLAVDFSLPHRTGKESLMEISANDIFLKLNSRRCLRCFSGSNYELRMVRDQQAIKISISFLSMYLESK